MIRRVLPGNAPNTPARVILVDGRELAQLIMDHNVGATLDSTYRVRRLDLDYFEADEASAPPSNDPTAPPQGHADGQA
jgi:hypothetical protein